VPIADLQVKVCSSLSLADASGYQHDGPGDGEFTKGVARDVAPRSLNHETLAPLLRGERCVRRGTGSEIWCRWCREADTAGMNPAARLEAPSRKNRIRCRMDSATRPPLPPLAKGGSDGSRRAQRSGDVLPLAKGVGQIHRRDVDEFRSFAGLLTGRRSVLIGRFAGDRLILASPRP